MNRTCLLVIRIRGQVNVSKREEDTLRMLRIDRNNHATLLDNRSSYLGMLNEAKDFITWGEPTIKTISLLLKKRGLIKGNKKLDDKTISDLGFNNIEELSESIFISEKEIQQIKPVKPFFRLHPPKGGFKNSIKKPFRSKGELGYRGEKINELAKKMC
jgi:large subunit ribosomal protein L30